MMLLLDLNGHSLLMPAATFDVFSKFFLANLNTADMLVTGGVSDLSVGLTPACLIVLRPAG